MEQSQFASQVSFEEMAQLIRFQFLSNQCYKEFYDSDMCTDEIKDII